MEPRRDAGDHGPAFCRTFCPGFSPQWSPARTAGNTVGRVGVEVWVPDTAMEPRQDGGEHADWKNRRSAS